MDLQHTAWQARRTRRLDIFEVIGRVTPPEPQMPDGGVIVTTQTRLEKLDHQPHLPSILLLRLDVYQERQYPYTPPARGLPWLARYYQTPIGPDEDACTTVHIRYKGAPITEIEVRDG